MTATANVSKRRAWLIATRPQTLPAAAAPVIVGTALAFHDGVFSPGPAIAAFAGAALIQIGTNLANDYYDAIKGVDTDDREGFTRVTQAGLIAPDAVRNAAIASFALSILVGTYLVYVGGIPIVVIGLAGVLSGLAYAGGPYPLGSHGLGDLFVFTFFGVIAVMGTYYVQATAAFADPFPLLPPPDTITVEAFAASLPIAALATCILIVNNVRDLETDREAGKRTLAVLIGYRWSRAEYVCLLVLAYLVPVWFWWGGFDPLVLLPIGTLPYAAFVAHTVVTETSGEALNPALERTGRLLAIYAILFAIGVVV